MTGPDLSFVIPAYNEERSLPGTLESIKRFVPNTLEFEVIVADNGSSDDTVAIAQKKGAVVVSDASATVAGLRNIAVKRAKGKVYVFLDADVELTAQWGHMIETVYLRLVENPWQLTGSRCGIGHNAGWIETCWFNTLIKKQANYINSGHLIVSRLLFERIGGFDANLQTGEDYRFSMAAKALEAEIHPEPALEVIHTGYPQTLIQFIRREIWHGKGDCVSFNSIIHSKVAIFAILVAVLSALSLLGLASNYPVIGLIGLALLLLFCLVMAVFKHRSHTPSCLLAVSAMYYVYFMSRFISCVLVLLALGNSKRHR